MLRRAEVLKHALTAGAVPEAYQYFVGAGAMLGCMWGVAAGGVHGFDTKTAMPWFMKPTETVFHAVAGGVVGTALGAATAAALPVSLPTYAVYRVMAANDGK
jgi:hypothetical protein